MKVSLFHKNENTEQGIYQHTSCPILLTLQTYNKVYGFSSKLLIIYITMSLRYLKVSCIFDMLFNFKGYLSCDKIFSHSIAINVYFFNWRKTMLHSEGFWIFVFKESTIFGICDVIVDITAHQKLKFRRTFNYFFRNLLGTKINLVQY